MEYNKSHFYFIAIWHLAADYHCIFNIEKLAFLLKSGGCAAPPPPQQLLLHLFISFLFLSFTVIIILHFCHPLIAPPYLTLLLTTLISALLSPPYLTVDC